MRELQIADVRRMTALRHGNDVVDAGRKRVRPLHAEIHRYAADTAILLRGIDLLV